MVYGLLQTKKCHLCESGDPEGGGRDLQMSELNTWLENDI